MPSSHARFEDRFSRQASAYARHRPSYPRELFEWIAAIAPGQELAWDCGTGNGQAAVALRAHFARVIATDPSEAQIASAVRADGIEYVIAPAERAPLADGSVSLIAIASALHWFRLDAFYSEAKRVLAPGGVIAAWAYRECHVSNDIDSLIVQVQNEILGQYWSERVSIVAARFRDIPFPFAEIDAPSFAAAATWTADEMLGYISTWSASQAYLEGNGSAATEVISEELRRAWGSGVRDVRWPLFMRVGRV